MDIFHFHRYVFKEGKANVLSSVECLYIPGHRLVLLHITPKIIDEVLYPGYFGASQDEHILREAEELRQGRPPASDHVYFSEVHTITANPSSVELVVAKAMAHIQGTMCLKEGIEELLKGGFS